jgi:hypothetical protein
LIALLHDETDGFVEVDGSGRKRIQELRAVISAKPADGVADPSPKDSLEIGGTKWVILDEDGVEKAPSGVNILRLQRSHTLEKRTESTRKRGR